MKSLFSKLFIPFVTALSCNSHHISIKSARALRRHTDNNNGRFF